MKYRLRTLLLIMLMVALSIGGVMVWLTRPLKIAQQYADELGNFEFGQYPITGKPEIVSHRRSLPDMLLGRQAFDVTVDSGSDARILVRFVVTRGNVAVLEKSIALNGYVSPGEP